MFAARYPLLGVKTSLGTVLPLALRMESCATKEESERNISRTFLNGYERFNEHLDTKTGTLHICGAGPSLEDSYKELSGDVLACNAAIRFLVDRGVIPTFGMMWDASPVLEAFCVRHPDITYLLASRCHEVVFNKLSGLKTIVWHAGGDHDVYDYLSTRGIIEPLVNGGSAAVTRALFLGYAMGYRDLHIHGGDSSYRGDATHICKSLSHEKRITVCVNKKFFDCTPEWAAQVEEFKFIKPALESPEFGVKITVHGDGLLPYVSKLMEEK